MDFTFTEDQRMFRDSLRDFLSNECTPERIRASWQTETGRSPELWAKLAELGLLGLTVPEEHGGLGMNEMDLVLPLEETGRAGLPEPVVETVAVGVPLLRSLDSKDLGNQWLPKVAGGEAIITVGHPLNPTVTDAHVAHLLLLPHGDEIHAVTLDRVTVERQPCSDPSRRLFRVEWKPGADTRVAGGEKGRVLLNAALDRAALACAAQQLGIGQKMIEIAVAYAKDRVQFGKPIGSFQAIKHMLASAQVRVDFSRSVVYRAAFGVAHNTPSRSAEVSHAKLAASDAAALVAKTALQVHGAIGYTWECDLQIWMQRAWALGMTWGTGAFHRDRVGAALLDAADPVRSFGIGAVL
jgi:alkylation response protein AidB-like acyl-CoA dehydrogenase